MNSAIQKPLRANDKKNFEFHSKFQPVYRISTQEPEIKSHQMNQSDDSFVFAIAPVSTFLQFFALMPVCGISHGDSRRLEFKWRSMRTLYSIFSIGYGVLMSIFFFKFLINFGVSSKNIC